MFLFFRYHCSRFGIYSISTISHTHNTQRSNCASTFFRATCTVWEFLASTQQIFTQNFFLCCFSPIKRLNTLFFFHSTLPSVIFPSLSGLRFSIPQSHNCPVYKVFSAKNQKSKPKRKLHKKVKFDEFIPTKEKWEHETSWRKETGKRKNKIEIIIRTITFEKYFNYIICMRLNGMCNHATRNEYFLVRQWNTANRNSSSNGRRRKNKSVRNEQIVQCAQFENRRNKYEMVKFAKKEGSFKQNDFGSAFFFLLLFKHFKVVAVPLFKLQKFECFCFSLIFILYHVFSFMLIQILVGIFLFIKPRIQTLRLKSCRRIERNKQTCSHILKSHLFLWLNSRTICVKRKNAVAVQIAFNKEPNQLISFCCCFEFEFCLRRNKI